MGKPEERKHDVDSRRLATAYQESISSEMLMLAFILRKGFAGRNYTGEAIFIGKDHVLTEGSLTPE
ncbi:MAG: hypothetical protein HDS23_07050 [Bacteroides sp.]|nr:hypothetical protein [Bacteroides sp.]